MSDENSRPYGKYRHHRSAMSSFDFEFCITPEGRGVGRGWFGPDIEGVASVRYDPSDAGYGAFEVIPEDVSIWASRDTSCVPIDGMAPRPKLVTPDINLAKYLAHVLNTDPAQRARIMAAIPDAESDADRRAEAVARAFREEPAE